MSRPPLPIGSWGSISTSVEKTDDKASLSPTAPKTKFRDHDGHVRVVSAFGKTKTAAERALLTKLQDRAKTSQSGELTAMHKISHLLDLWEKRFEGLVADGTRSPTSLDTYRRAIKNHIRPALGELRIGEATTPRIDTVLSKIKNTAGAPTAKTCRAVISGAMKLAVRYGATSVNPVREVDAIEAKPKNPPRALTAEEVTLLRKSLAADERAVQADLPDLVTFMLGTGVRIGEALAVLWHQVDLEAGTVEITHTIARVTRRRPPPQDHQVKSRRTRSSASPAGPLAMLRSTPRRRHPPRRPDLRRHPRRLPRPLQRPPLPPHRPLPRRQHRPPRPRPVPPGPPPQRRHDSQAGRRSSRLAPDQDRAHRNRPHQGRPATRRRPRQDLRHQPRGLPNPLKPRSTTAAQPAESDKLAWIRSHALRKTTATALDEAGHTARQIADQLGQAKVSITQDVYLGRRAANPAAAEALEQAFEDPDLI